MAFVNLTKPALLRARQTKCLYFSATQKMKITLEKREGDTRGLKSRHFGPAKTPPSFFQFCVPERDLNEKGITVYWKSGVGRWVREETLFLCSALHSSWEEVERIRLSVLH